MTSLTRVVVHGVISDEQWGAGVAIIFLDQALLPPILSATPALSSAFRKILPHLKSSDSIIYRSIWDQSLLVYLRGPSRAWLLEMAIAESMGCLGTKIKRGF